MRSAMIKRLLLCLLLTLLLCTLLACNKGEDGEDNGDATPPPNTPPLAESDPAYGKDESVHLWVHVLVGDQKYNITYNKELKRGYVKGTTLEREGKAFLGLFTTDSFYYDRVFDEKLNYVYTGANKNYNIENLLDEKQNKVYNVYALYVDEQLTLRLDNDGGTVDDKTVTVTYGQDMSNVLTPAAKPGYVFVGWTVDYVTEQLVTDRYGVPLAGYTTLTYQNYPITPAYEEKVRYEAVPQEIVLRAKYEPDYVTLTLRDGDTLISEKQYLRGTELHESAVNDAFYGYSTENGGKESFGTLTLNDSVTLYRFSWSELFKRVTLHVGDLGTEELLVSYRGTTLLEVYYYKNAAYTVEGYYTNAACTIPVADRYLTYETAREHYYVKLIPLTE